MYVGYLVDKDTNMYPSPVRHPSLNLNPQNYVPGPPQYSDFASYHHVPGINNDLHHGQPAAAWGSPYTPAKEDWHSYGTAATPSTASPGQFGFSPPDFNPIQPPGSGLLPPPISSSVPQLSPNAQRRTPYEWMRRSIPSTSNNACPEQRIPLELCRAGSCSVALPARGLPEGQQAWPVLGTTPSPQRAEEF
ncbi:hypothetical protein DV515_00006871 [Chloebia gouldiae]|uniref:Caudal-like activation domain-containing protein n=1 Tax=Chloebia gouldiae TaxID=44316 RepID=A0A3L8SJH0_CHLGU|nr:hypothetical protein DV515_00006871 [Chloebia gouldiae]